MGASMTTSPVPYLSQPNQGTTAIGYVRVSTKKQLSGVGREAQSSAIETYAQAAGYQLVQIVEEHHSATDGTPLDARPGFREVLDLATLHNAVILVTRMDRVSRHLPSYNSFVDRHQFAIIPVCEMDVAVLPGQKARIAEGQVIVREKTARQAKAFDRMRAAGKPLGNPKPSPLTHKRSQEVRKRLARERQLRIADVMEEVDLDVSRPELARLLNERGILSGQGKTWTATMLRRDHDAAKEILKERRSANKSLADDGADAEELKRLQNDPTFGMF